jgi:hypothetical protein
VGNWLHGVAYNIALKARSQARRRRAREREAAAMPKPEPAHEQWRQLEPLLDAAVHSLPDKYRVPIVLCDLEGKTRKEAARQLGCPEGTIASRLARARQMLARRLSRHGLALSAATLATALSYAPASAGLARPLVSAVVRAGALIAAGKELPAGTISARALALKEGVLQAMFMTKLKIAVSVVVLALLTCAAAISFPHFAPAQEKNADRYTTPSQAPPQDPQAKSADHDKNANRYVVPHQAPPKDDTKAKDPSPAKSDHAGGLILRRVVLDDVDVKHQTIAVSVACTKTDGDPFVDKTKLVGLPVARDAQILVGSNPAKLAALKPGMSVAVKLTVEQNQLVVIGITEEAHQAKGGTQAAYDKAKAEVEVAVARVKAAEANIKLAQATVDLLVADGKTGAELAQAKAVVQVAIATEVQARQEAAQAQARLADIAAKMKALEGIKALGK